MTDVISNTCDELSQALPVSSQDPSSVSLCSICKNQSSLSKVKIGSVMADEVTTVCNLDSGSGMSRQILYDGRLNNESTRFLLVLGVPLEAG